MRTAFASSCLFLLGSLGCGESPSTLPASEHGLPWITLDEDRFGSGFTGPAMENGKALTDENGQSVMKFGVTNREFGDLLENIKAEFNATIIVRPAELATRGITLDVTGADAQAALADVARQCRLELETIGDMKWRLSLPGSDGASERTIELTDE